MLFLGATALGLLRMAVIPVQFTVTRVSLQIAWHLPLALGCAEEVWDFCLQFFVLSNCCSYFSVLITPSVLAMTGVVLCFKRQSCSAE